MNGLRLVCGLGAQRGSGGPQPHVTCWHYCTLTIFSIIISRCDDLNRSKCRILNPLLSQRIGYKLFAWRHSLLFGHLKQIDGNRPVPIVGDRWWKKRRPMWTYWISATSGFIHFLWDMSCPISRMLLGCACFLVIYVTRCVICLWLRWTEGWTA